MGQRFLTLLIQRMLFKRCRIRHLSLVTIIAVIAGVLIWRNGGIPLLPQGFLDNLSLESIASSAKRIGTTDGGSFEYTPGFPQNGNGIFLQRIGYRVSYNRDTMQPNWVAWRLTGGHCSGNAGRDGKEFTEDESVPSPRADTYDYTGTGYDRGHMCPAADNKWSHDAMEQSFLMTNICPQNPELNRGDWNEIEQQCRVWAKQYGKIYIVCGPVFLRGKHRKIGKHSIPVPDAFFKVVLRMSPEPRGIGFICRNTDGSHPKDFYVNSISEIERITGYKFFPNLKGNISRMVKSSRSLNDWRFVPSRYHKRNQRRY